MSLRPKSISELIRVEAVGLMLMLFHFNTDSHLAESKINSLAHMLSNLKNNTCCE